MPIVKRVFSIPDEVSARLNESVPNQERSKFVTQTLVDALQKKSREELIKKLDGLEPWEAREDGKSVVEILREIRETESKRVTDNL